MFWRGFLRALKQRGLAGVRLVISDQHAGLVAALRRVLPGRRPSTLPGPLRPQPARPGPQVAQGHGRRGVPHHLRPTRPRRRRGDLGPGPRPARRPASPRSAPLMDDAKAEVLAFTAFPRAHWPKIWSTNPLERVNKEIKRRARVVGHLPQRGRRHPPRRRRPGRHPRRMASPATAATSPKASMALLYPDQRY